MRDTGNTGSDGGPGVRVGIVDLPLGRSVPATMVQHPAIGQNDRGRIISAEGHIRSGSEGAGGRIVDFRARSPDSATHHQDAAIRELLHLMQPACSRHVVGVVQLPATGS